MSTAGPLLVLVAVLAAALAAALAMPARRPALPHGDRGSADDADQPSSRLTIPWPRVLPTVAVGLGVVMMLTGPLGWVAAPVAAAVCWRVTGRLEPPAVRRRRERLVAGVPHVVDLMSACLTAGLSPGAALEQVASAVEDPMAEELAALSSRLRLGVDPSTAWRDLARHPQLGGVGRAVSRAVDSGASVAEAMLRLSEDLRREARTGMETRARAVGVRAAIPLGLCLLPAFVLIGVVPLVAGSVSVLVGP